MRTLVLTLILCGSAVADEDELITLFKTSVIDAAKDPDKVSIRVKLEHKMATSHLGESSHAEHCQGNNTSLFDISTRPGMRLFNVESDLGTSINASNDTYTFEIVGMPGHPAQLMSTTLVGGSGRINGRFVFGAYCVDKWRLADRGIVRSCVLEEMKKGGVSC